MKKVEPGSILVFHDSEKAFANLQIILPQLLQFYQQEGYTLLALNKDICAWK
jgi:hypothetical protein